jgi:hypothetical protein
MFRGVFVKIPRPGNFWNYFVKQKKSWNRFMDQVYGAGSWAWYMVH